VANVGSPLSLEDHAELSRLFRQHFAVLLDGATALSEHDGADIVAEAFEALAAGTRSWDRNRDFVKFVMFVIHSIYANRRKKDRRLARKTADVEEADAIPPSSDRTDVARRDALMARLDDKERAYVELLEADVLDAEEQGKALGVSATELSKIKRRVAYAVERVQEDLEKDERREDLSMRAKA
jgi:DNA-directed RNA polymerase specialized sigma24 family protein